MNIYHAKLQRDSKVNEKSKMINKRDATQQRAQWRTVQSHLKSKWNWLHSAGAMVCKLQFQIQSANGSYSPTTTPRISTEIAQIKIVRI